jgi:hypothetical protein
MRKTEYWKYTYEDAMDLIARLPEVAALVYSRSFGDGTIVPHDKVRVCVYGCAPVGLRVRAAGVCW